ncbi:uncharacterized protein LOC125225035 [Leguminivora glycinivorella]|uniref:uncharacterized protein LOC125225035 n=1 Tax=Leguminivora glycinivorella TaxID=1035111 RepID=UPI0020108629|nr:uncharacterized protein LOC125225035 [Leguminivora glycinivorella]
MACADGTCIPRDWICDGAHDCPAGEDENICGTCMPHEFRCESGTCIHSRWKCDGYADCPDGDDESEAMCGGVREDLGEEPAGSAPAPAVHRPNRVPAPHKARSGDDSSKELLMTSDSTNALKRNFTRRPSLSRLTPYSPAMLQATKVKRTESEDDAPKKTNRRLNTEEENEDIQPDDLTVLEDMKVDTELQEKHKRAEERPSRPANLSSKNQTKVTYKNLTRPNPLQGRAPMPRPKPAKVEHPAMLAYPAEATKLDQSINKLERVINGADLMRMLSQKAQRPSPTTESGESVENTTPERAEPDKYGRATAHASPCPDSELRCVDGRCITLAQLCDGTIDCSDHADEDNCYT